MKCEYHEYQTILAVCGGGRDNEIFVTIIGVLDKYSLAYMGDIGELLNNIVFRYRLNCPYLIYM